MVKMNTDIFRSQERGAFFSNMCDSDQSPMVSFNSNLALGRSPLKRSFTPAQWC